MNSTPDRRLRRRRTALGYFRRATEYIERPDRVRESAAIQGYLFLLEWPQQAHHGAIEMGRASGSHLVGERLARQVAIDHVVIGRRPVDDHLRIRRSPGLGSFLKLHQLSRGFIEHVSEGIALVRTI